MAQSSFRLEWLMNRRDKACAPHQARCRKKSSANFRDPGVEKVKAQKIEERQVAQDCDDFASARWLLFAGQALAANCAGARPPDISLPVTPPPMKRQVF
jgi:hypothetical protein